MNSVEQWVALAALVQAALIIVVLVLLRNEQRRAPKGR